MRKQTHEEKDFQEIYKRLQEVTGCTTQMEIAEFLGIRQSSVSIAKQRKSLPAEWVLAVFERLNISPTWLKTGQGEKYCVHSKNGNSSTEHLREIVRKALMDEIPDISEMVTERILASLPEEIC